MRRTIVDAKLPAMPARLVAVTIAVLAVLISSAQSRQSDSKKEDKKKKSEPFKIVRVTQGLGLYAIGDVSPNGESVLLLAQKPNESPNLYVMKLANHSIRPQQTCFKKGVANPR